MSTGPTAAFVGSSVAVGELEVVTVVLVAVTVLELVLLLDLLLEPVDVLLVAEDEWCALFVADELESDAVLVSVVNVRVMDSIGVSAGAAGMFVGTLSSVSAPAGASSCAETVATATRTMARAFIMAAFIVFG